MLPVLIYTAERDSQSRSRRWNRGCHEAAGESQSSGVRVVSRRVRGVLLGEFVHVHVVCGRRLVYGVLLLLYQVAQSCLPSVLC